MPFSLVVIVLAACPGAKAAQAETLVSLKVYPRAAPKPALRYQLLPELREMTPGNPIEGYLECLLDQDFSGNQDLLPRSALRKADRAARMDKPDWQIFMKSKTEGYGLLIPDVQKIRQIAASLRERFHSEVSQGRLDEAIATAKTMFALSRHLKEHPSLIGNLVGLACAYLALPGLEEMMERSDSPNLYWALTNLPRPFIPIDNGIAGERLMFQGALSTLDDSAPMTAGELQKLVAQVDKAFGFNFRVRELQTGPWLEKKVRDKGFVDAARARLIEGGIPGEKVQKFPAEQVLLLDQQKTYELRQDEIMKLLNLPLWECLEHLEKVEANINAEEARYRHLFAVKDTILAGAKIARVQGRLDQRIALLRHVEAIRLYAADHRGALPAQLSDIGVPLPVDPFTGKPFRYVREGATAHLRGTPPAGNETEATYNLHYEITIRQP